MISFIQSSSARLETETVNKQPWELAVTVCLHSTTAINKADGCFSWSLYISRFFFLVAATSKAVLFSLYIHPRFTTTRSLLLYSEPLTMGSVISSLSSLPSLREFITLTPKTYAVLLNIFQYFPAVRLPQTTTQDTPPPSIANKTNQKLGNHNPMAPLLPPCRQNLPKIFPPKPPRSPRLVRHGNRRAPKPPLHPSQLPQW